MTRVWKWNRPVTVREVLEDLQQERSIAYTTVMTVLDNLHQKGWVRREAEGRAYRYEAVSTRAAYSAALMNEAWTQSDNPAAALVAFFGMMSPEQREALRDAVRMVQGPEETPAPQNPTAENATAENATAENAAVENPAAENTAVEMPAAENPAVENPVGENPAAAGGETGR
ncbi:BlaI/MecI/CopY family transcriptional regulator [Streptomyces sp. 2-1]|uniref:BlaI/MecI/CopY family transcriptional regulator n=1 Tax=Streptomyces sp. 2-1 TaxID=412710 RepID=UPI003AFAE04C